MSNAPAANCVSPVLIAAAFILTKTCFGLVILGVGRSITSYSAGLHFFGATRERMVGGNSAIFRL